MAIAAPERTEAIKIENPERRAFVRMASALVATSLTGSATIAKAADKAPTKNEDAKRLWIVGDSTAQAVGQGFEFQTRDVPTIKVRNIFRNASGLMRPDFYDWPKTVRGLLAREKAPEAVVLSFGANDTQGIVLDPRTIARPGEDAWHDAYKAKVAAFLKLFTEAGSPVFLLGLPFDPKTRMATGLAAVNRAFRDAASATEKCEFVDSEKLLLAEDGSYQKQVRIGGQTLTLRNQDGVHLTADGGRYLAKLSLGAIRKGMGLPE
jgi:uncharacterized protein